MVSPSISQADLICLLHQLYKKRFKQIIILVSLVPQLDLHVVFSTVVLELSLEVRVDRTGASKLLPIVSARGI